MLGSGEFVMLLRRCCLLLMLWLLMLLLLLYQPDIPKHSRILRQNLLPMTAKVFEYTLHQSFNI